MKHIKRKGSEVKKTALITGGSSGLGYAIAANLSEKGYQLILIARNEERLETARKKLSSKGADVRVHACDISDDTAVTRLFQKIESLWDAIDLLVLNAGIVQTKLMGDYTDARELKSVLDIDLWGTILCTNTFLPLMKEGGRVLMVSSGFGLMGPAGYSTYAAAKAGIINFAQSLRRELLVRNIHVSVACPGDMDTPQLHEEFNAMPEWMRGNEKSPRGMMSPDKAALGILKQCFKNRFLIIINFELTAFLMLQRILPRFVMDYVVDKMFPLPSKR